MINGNVTSQKIMVRALNVIKVMLNITIALHFLSACNNATDKKSPSSEASVFNNEIIKTIAGKFTPPAGKTLLFIGQDSDTISNYIINTPEDPIEGVTLYSQLKNADPSQTLKAMFSPAFWDSGTMDFSLTLTESPNAALAIGLALDTCGQENHPKNIADGLYDNSINTLIDYLKSLTPRKVFLRIGYEFDGPWNCYTPEEYKAAFVKIATSLQQNNVTNVATVWQSATWPDATIAGENTHLYDLTDTNHFNNWYPGDAYVDWVGVSVFYRNLNQWNYLPPTSPELAQESLLAFARSKGKPVMIAEASPQGYNIGGLTHSVIQENKQKPVTDEEVWQGWFVPFFNFIDTNRDVIKAVAYINTEWFSQGMWQCEPNISAGQAGCNQGYWGDARVYANPLIKERWLKEVNNAERWLQTSNY